MNTVTKPHIFRSILLTSLLTFLLAELFFAFWYYVVIHLTQMLQIAVNTFFSSGFEANSGIFTPVMMIIFVIGLLLISVITFLEIATIIAITAYDYFRDDHIPLKSLLFFVFERLKKVFTWKTLPVFLAILLLPKDHIGTSGLYSLEIPPFILDAIWQNPLYTTLLLVAAGGVLYLSFRIMFFIHALILWDEKSLFGAWKKSWQLSKKMGFWRFVKMLFVALFFAFLLIVIVFLLMSIIELGLEHWGSFLGVFGVFVYTVINYLQGFLALAIPGVMVMALLTVHYIEMEGFDQKDFLRNFRFLGEAPTPVKRGKNLRLLLGKFGSKNLLIVTLLLTVVLTFLSSLFIKIHTFELPSVDYLAHRGYLHTETGKNMLIENTMKAVENAYLQGANIIEIDVFENKDGSLYLSHDPTLKRVAGIDREIAEMTDAELDAVVLPDSSHIPRLEEVLEFGKQHAVTILIEPKIHGKEKHLYQTVVDLVQKYDMYDLVKVHSLSLQTVLEIDAIDPKIEVGYTIFGGIGNLSLIPVDFYSIQETVISPSIIDNIHASGKKIYLWTLNKTENLEKYLFMGIDGVITDELEMVRHAVSELQKTYAKNPRYYLEIFGYKILIPHFMQDSENADSAEVEGAAPSTEVLIDSLDDEIFLPLATSSTRGITAAMKRNPHINALLQRAKNDPSVVDALRQKADSLEEPKRELWQWFIEHFEAALKEETEMSK